MPNIPRIIITGSSGFIGTNAVDYFLSRGYAVSATDLVLPRSKDRPRVFTQCDLLDATGLKRLFANFNPDYLLHLGARTDLLERKSLAGYAANIQGVQNILDAARACPGLRRIIVTSSRFVCPMGYTPSSEEDYCPPNLYGQSKVETERLTRSANLRTEWLITRPSGIWGPGFRTPYRDFFEQVRHARYFHLGAANPRKTLGYVKNSVFQMEKLLLAPAVKVQGRVFYIGDYEPVLLRNWANLVAREFGKEPPRALPLGLLRAGALVGDVLMRLGWTSVPLMSSRLRNMLTETVHDFSPLQSITGPLPYDLATATHETVLWLKDNP
jgi:nucleoside-diphosphate-sugar epimerase